MRLTAANLRVFLADEDSLPVILPAVSRKAAARTSDEPQTFFFVPLPTRLPYDPLPGNATRRQEHL